MMRWTKDGVLQCTVLSFTVRHTAYCSLSLRTFTCSYVMPAGKFVAIHGTVIRVSNVKPLVKKMAFSCNLCSETQVSMSGVFSCCLLAFLLSTPFSLLLSLLHSLPFFIQFSNALLLFLPPPYLLFLNPLLGSLLPSLPLSLPPCCPYFPPTLLSSPLLLCRFSPSSTSSLLPSLP